MLGCRIVDEGFFKSKLKRKDKVIGKDKYKKRRRSYSIDVKAITVFTIKVSCLHHLNKFLA